MDKKKVAVGFTRMSSKGQIVIPKNLRRDLNLGDEFVIIRRDKDIILKPASSLEKSFREDLDFAKKTASALERYKKGQYKEKSGPQFIEDLETL